MSATAAPTPATAAAIPDIKQQFLDAYEKEHKITMRVLNAYPREHSELRPHVKLRTARELAWVFVMERALAGVALTKGFDWSSPAEMPPAPDSLDAIIQAL